MVLAHQVTYESLINFLQKEDSFVLPNFIRIIPELCCEYKIPLQTQKIQNVTKSKEIENAIQIHFESYRDIHLIVSSKFESAKTVQAFAKKNKLSVMWIDSQVLNNDNDDDNLNFSNILAN